MKKELQAIHADTQSEMDEGVYEFNCQRPHQARHGDTLCELDKKSTIPYTDSLVDYGCKDMPTRIINQRGGLKWHGMNCFLAEALRGS